LKPFPKRCFGNGGGIVGGGAIYAGLEKLADAIKNKAK